jgi:GMP synthase (glutamine-hydrolysing)
VIVYVDLEHEQLQEQPELWEKSLAGRLKYKYRLEEVSGDVCLIVHYTRLSLDLLRQLKVRAVVVSGCRTDFEHYAEERLAGLRAVYREAAWPTLAFCGGMQLLAQTYGAKIGPLGPLSPGAPDPYEGAYIPGVKQERGFMPVRVRPVHPLFSGLDPQPVFFQSHYWEVKTVPTGFHLLAETDLCPIQAIAHTERPIFGVQFHPEQYNAEHLDGRRVLENFFKSVLT